MWTCRSCNGQYLPVVVELPMTIGRLQYPVPVAGGRCESCQAVITHWKDERLARQREEARRGVWPVLDWPALRRQVIEGLRELATEEPSAAFGEVTMFPDEFRIRVRWTRGTSSAVYAAAALHLAKRLPDFIGPETTALLFVDCDTHDSMLFPDGAQADALVAAWRQARDAGLAGDGVLDVRIIPPPAP
jgi:hypothetical protein